MRRGQPTNKGDMARKMEPLKEILPVPQYPHKFELSEDVANADRIVTWMPGIKLDGNSQYVMGIVCLCDFTDNSKKTMRCLQKNVPRGRCRTAGYEITSE